MCEDPTAFRAWYEATLPTIYGFVLARCAGATSVAEELTQDAFVEAIRMRNRFDGRAEPVTWLIAIARHKLADHYRRRAREDRRRMNLVTDPRLKIDEIAATERREDILRVVRSLPPSQQAVIVYRYLDDLPVAAIAAEIGRSETATESLLARAREALRQALDVKDDSDD